MSRHESTQRSKIVPQKTKPWTYPPLPPNHTVPCKKVSFSCGGLDIINSGGSSNRLIDYVYDKAECDKMTKIVSKYGNESDHESSDCESILSNGNEFEDKIQGKFINLDELEDLGDKNNKDRMRGGCGSNCFCPGEDVACDNQMIEECQGSVKKTVTIEDCNDHKNYETCSIKRNRSSSQCKTAVVNKSSYCCPTADSLPVCAKSSRCNSPCISNKPGCSSGGCCGTGCRGGCGKPGPLCMPLRTCSGSTYTGRSFVSKSHWSLSKSDTPRPVSHSRTQTVCGQSDISVNQQLCSPRTVNDYDNCKQLNRSKSRCECLGGGMDCQRCGRKVYQAEMMIAAGSPYHNICFSCYCCRKPLEPLTYQENCHEIYCKQCLIRNFGPQGYGYGVGAGVLQTPI